MSFNPPPIYEKVTDDEQKATLPYILFFNQLFSGDQGTAFTPTFTNLTSVGTPSIAGIYYRLSSTLVYFAVTIQPGTSTSAVAGSTYFDFPLTLTNDGACLAVSGGAGTNAGMAVAVNNRVYTPAWSVVTVPVTVIGIVEAT